MGHVLLPTGTTVFLEGLNGSVNLSQLIVDMRCDDYTPSYRLSTIAALGKLGKHADTALPVLRELSNNKRDRMDDKLLREAADQAIKKIEASPSLSRHPSVHGGLHGGAGGVRHDNSSLNYAKKPEVNKITFVELDATELHEGVKHYCQCSFCNKMVVINEYIRENLDNLTNGKFYCNFCLRNDYYQKAASNVMILTYRGILGYYYYSYHSAPKTPFMYMGEFNDLLELHVNAGMQNPLFRYDPDTFCWFVDFNKVGKKKMPLESVLCTIIEQLACMKIYDNCRECSGVKLYEKYKHAVMEFDEHRVRTNNDQVFAPTFWGCDIPVITPTGKRPIPVSMLQNFLPANLQDANVNRTKKFNTM